MTYTLAQLHAFVAAAGREDRQREASMAVAVRMGMGADKNQWSDYLRRMNN